MTEQQITNLVNAWSPMAQAVLNAMSAEFAYPAAMVSATAAAESGIQISEKQTLDIMRAFRTLGIADFGCLYDDDSTYLKGRGYWVSAKGLYLRNALASLATETK